MGLLCVTPVLVFAFVAIAVPGASARLVARWRAAFTLRALVVPVWAFVAMFVASVAPRASTSAWSLWLCGAVSLFGWVVWATWTRLPALSWLAWGMVSNLLVMVVNRGMPVRLSPDLVGVLGSGTIEHHAMTSADRLRFLGDVIHVPGTLLGGFYSVGDFALVVGLVAVVVSLVKREAADSSGRAAVVV